MPLPDIQQFNASAATAGMISAGQSRKAAADAQSRLGSALNDLAMIQVASNQMQDAMKLLMEAVERCPAERDPFHNLVASMLMHRQLRGRNLQQLAGHVAKLMNQGVAWAADYDCLQWLPDRLSVVLVAGRCNLKCRMCYGVNQENRNTQFRFTTTDQFRKMLQHAPTASHVSFAPADSDTLMHPEFDKLLQLAQQHGVMVSLFSNAVALTSRLAEMMIDTGTVAKINFSLDAATPDTYKRIRGADFERTLRNIRRLVDYGKQPGKRLPRIEFSFVGMSDNIQELPAFIQMAAEYSVAHVNLQDLTGWDNRAGENHVAQANPHWREAVTNAMELARQNHISLYVPHSLQPGQTDAAKAADQENQSLRAYSRCPWMEEQAIWVYVDGCIRPCCHGTSARIADLGNLFDRPLHQNEPYNQAMRLMHQGKVFSKCLPLHCCNYVTQERNAGRKLQVIEACELLAA